VFAKRETKLKTLKYSKYIFSTEQSKTGPKFHLTLNTILNLYYRYISITYIVRNLLTQHDTGSIHTVI